MIENIILFILFLGILIFVHELGHFIFAKILKVDVEEFALGFPPRLISKKINETVYSLNLIFFGGYVKLRGEDNVEDPYGFLNQPAYKKILITLGGVIFNLIFAYFLFSIGYLYGLPEFAGRISNITVVQVFKDSPAEKADIKIGDVILYFKYKNKLIEIKNIQNVKDVLKDYIGEEITIGILRGKEKLEVKLVPEIKDSIGPLGIAFSSIKLEKKPFPSNFYYGLIKTYEVKKNLIFAFKEFFVRLFKEIRVAKEVVGPLGIYDIYTQMRTLGISYILHFMALISLNLVLINILPFPALDGGRFIVYFGELITGKRIPFKIENLINIIGVTILLILALIITVKDIYYKIK